MARLLDRLIRPTPAGGESRALVEVLERWRDGKVRLEHDFASFADRGFRNSGPVFACETARMMLFAQTGFAYKRLDDGQYDPPPLALRRPRDVLARLIIDADMAGTAFVYKAAPNRLQRFRPDWIQVLSEDGAVTSYVYTIGGVGSGGEQRVFFPDEMVHWAPDPDPLCPIGLGMPWPASVTKEILSDQQMQTHKQSFYGHAATPNLLLTFERSLTDDARRRITEDMQRRYAGVDNAYKTLVMDGAAGKVDVHAVGSDFRQMDFARVQDAGETRIASAAGVPPVLVGFSQGLAAATYSNYLHAMRRFADHTIRPLWHSFTETVAPLFPNRVGAELVYDDRRIPALQQDAKDDAEIVNFKANTMAQLIRSGYDPDSVTEAIVGDRLDRLQHTGNVPTALYNPEDMEKPEESDENAEESVEEPANV